jgi:tetraacyldisaccharide 4'-kinase
VLRQILGLPLAAASRLRRAAYEHGFLRRERLTGPVVSVGNLAVGGRGKTPVVARVCEILREEGQAVAVLSRGYKGSFRGDCLVVSDGTRVLATAAEAGDEPVMLARQLPGVVVAIGPRRAVVGRAVEARFGACVHVLDDGFQHLALQRDLDLVCLEASDLHDSPMPGGRLRESPAALSRADLLLVAAAANAPDRLFGPDLPPARVLRLHRRKLGLFTREGASAATPLRPFLLAAIAEPERFRDVAAFHEVAGTAFFRDHHVFATPQLQRVARDARARGADAIVTTAKDEVRLPTDLDLGLPLLVLRIAVVIENEDVLRGHLRRVATRAA